MNSQKTEYTIYLSYDCKPMFGTIKRCSPAVVMEGLGTDVPNNFLSRHYSIPILSLFCPLVNRVMYLKIVAKMGPL
jgi:hypothetical protein